MTDKSVAGYETLVSLVRTALEDNEIGSRLWAILSQPPFQRKSLLHTMVADLKMQSVPADFVQAIACLLDGDVAEKAGELLKKE